MQLCGATVCDIYVWSYSHLNSVNYILCGSTVLHVSSKLLSPDSVDHCIWQVCAMLLALLTHVCWDRMDLLRFHCNWYAFVKVQSFSMKGNVHVLISTSVWIYLIEFGLDGTGPLYATCHCDVTCIVHPKQSNWDAAVWIHCMWHLCVKLQPFDLSQLHPVWIHCAAC